MPAPLVADWTQVRATAISLGSLTAAARAHGLPVDAVYQRACREEWPVGRRAARMAAQAQAQATEQTARAAIHDPPSVDVRSVRTDSGDAQVSALATLGAKSRHALATCLATASEHASALPGREALKQARNVHETAKAAALIHGWQDAAQTQAPLIGLSGCVVQVNVSRE